MNLLTPQPPFGPTNPAIPMASPPVQGDVSTPPTQADVVAPHPEDTIALSPQAAALTAADASAPPTIDPSAPIGSDQPDLTSQYAYKDRVDFTQGVIPSGYNVGNDTFHGGNGELQQYSPSQVTAVAGQGVVLTAAPNGDPNTAQDSPYVSGKVFDAQRGVSTGAVEFTATIPKGKGLWPAMWLLPKGQNAADGSDLQWPQTGEIDVSEIKGSDTTRSLATMHWGDAPGSPSKSQGPFATTDGTTDFADGNPHRFAAQWDSNGITSYVDGKKVGYTPFDDQQKATFASGQQFSPIINLAVGGKFDSTLYNPDPANANWRGEVKQNIDAAGTFANGQTPSMTVSNVTLYTNDPAAAASFDAPPSPPTLDGPPPADAPAPVDVPAPPMPPLPTFLDPGANGGTVNALI